MSLNKNAVREKIKKEKKQFTKEQLDYFSTEVIDSLLQLECFHNAKTVLVYYSMEDEVNTHSLIDGLLGDKRIILPVVNRDHLLLREYTSFDQMEISSYGILEPKGADFTNLKEIDVVIVPGVAFDRKLNRLGHGRGYYDRLLPQLKALKVGVCFDFQLLNEIPFDNFDVNMDMVVAQNEIIMS